ncbi:MAG: single-stranded DNA-binding protein [Lentisphaeria bacterium]|jgi:single-strand DNA-binding protein|nr:single-stranded DNA-binding protein [Lentisphaeria bacterium]
MASLNKVFLLGNLVRDPDLRGLPNGQSVCELRMAVSRRYTNGSGQEVEDTCFVDVVVWGKSAKNCKQYLAKGSQVMVEGRLQLDQWEDRNGGGMRSRLRVIAEQVQFMNRRSSADGEGRPAYEDGGAAPEGRRYGSAPASGAPGMPPMPEAGGSDAPVDDIPF